jgi:hypothetical protein
MIITASKLCYPPIQVLYPAASCSFPFVLKERIEKDVASQTFTAENGITRDQKRGCRSHNARYNLFTCLSFPFGITEKNTGLNKK